MEWSSAEISIAKIHCITFRTIHALAYCICTFVTYRSKGSLICPPVSGDYKI